MKKIIALSIIAVVLALSAVTAAAAPPPSSIPPTTLEPDCTTGVHDEFGQCAPVGSCSGICGPATVGGQQPHVEKCFDIGIGNGVGQSSTFFPCDLVTGDILIPEGVTYTVDPIDGPPSALTNEGGTIVSAPPYDARTLPETGAGEGFLVGTGIGLITFGAAAVLVSNRRVRDRKNTDETGGS